jgi:hypothetical protein
MMIQPSYGSFKKLIVIRGVKKYELHGKIIKFLIRWPPLQVAVQ